MLPCVGPFLARPIALRPRRSSVFECINGRLATFKAEVCFSDSVERASDGFLTGLGTDDQQIKRHLVTSWRIKGAQNGVVLQDTTAQRLGGRRWTPGGGCELSVSGASAPPLTIGGYEVWFGFCGFTLIVLSAT